MSFFINIWKSNGSTRRSKTTDIILKNSIEFEIQNKFHENSIAQTQIKFTRVLSGCQFTHLNINMKSPKDIRHCVPITLD